MKMRLHNVVLVLSLCTLASCSTEPIEADTTDITKAENVTEVETELLTVVNEHRKSLGEPVLSFSDVAYEHASAHNDYMIAKGDLSHDNFNSRASKISSKENAEIVAENVAKDYNTAMDAFAGWLNSSKHKKTMEGDFTHTAVSVKKDDTGNYYFTQLFYRK